jgi:ABC-type dipeptide/oligopeptide/nickel transport system permease subunit
VKTLKRKSRKDDVLFAFSRIINFMKVFFRNKRGMLGFSIIMGFVTIAITAPLLTPYTPLGQDPNAPNRLLAGDRAAPSWLRTLPPFLGGDPTLSENFVPISRPGLPTLTNDGGELVLETDEPDIISYEYSETGFPLKLPGYTKFENGSLAVKFYRSKEGASRKTRVFIYKEFKFPYNGIPARLMGNIMLFVNGSTHLEKYYNFSSRRFESVPFLDVPVRVRVLIGPVDGKLWELWPGTFHPHFAFTYPRGLDTEVVEGLQAMSKINTSNPIFSVWEYVSDFEKKNVTLVEWEDRDKNKVLSISDIVTFEGEETFEDYKIFNWEVKGGMLRIGISKFIITRPKSGSLSFEGWIAPRASIEAETTTIPTINQYTEFRDRKDYTRIIFSKTPGKYIYGVEIIFEDKEEYSEKDVWATVYVDDLDLFCYGTSFGLLGTNQLGHDLFSQLIYGTRVSLYLGLLVSILGVSIGLVVGLAAGYLGRIADELLMRFNDLLLCLPGLPLLIVLVAVLGTSIENLILLMGFLGWNGFARLVRSQVLSLKERAFVESAKAVGAGTGHIIWRHILPNVMSLVYISLATSVPGAVTAEASLAWLGFFDPNRMSWGRMLYDATQSGAINNWWWVIFPGLFISLLAVAFILLGFALDDILNPKLRIRR